MTAQRQPNLPTAGFALRNVWQLTETKLAHLPLTVHSMASGSSSTAPWAGQWHLQTYWAREHRSQIVFQRQMCYPRKKPRQGSCSDLIPQGGTVHNTRSQGIHPEVSSPTDHHCVQGMAPSSFSGAPNTFPWQCRFPTLAVVPAHPGSMPICLLFLNGTFQELEMTESHWTTDVFMKAL